MGVVPNTEIPRTEETNPTPSDESSVCSTSFNFHQDKDKYAEILNFNYDFINANTSSCPRIIVHFYTSDADESIPMTALLDSGATFSACSSSAFESAVSKLQLTKATRVRSDPSQADQSALRCNGECIANLSLQSTMNEVINLLNVRFTIIKNLSYHIIIGMDILSVLGFKIENENSVSLGGKHFSSVPPEVSLLKCRRINFDEYDFCLSQISFDHRPTLTSDTDCTLIEAKAGSDIFFESLCYINFKSPELERSFKINLLHDSVKSGTSLQEIANNLQINSGKCLWSGSFKICELNNPIENKDRKLIKENFYVDLVNKSAFLTGEKEKLKQVLQEFRPVFSRDETDIGLFVGEEVEVKLRDKNAEIPYLRNRPIPFAAKEFVREKVKELTERKIFEEVHKGSPYNSPAHIVMTKKDDGSTKFRLTVDYSQLNKFLVPDSYPIPRIRDIINDLEGSKFFSSIDLRSGFWNLKLKKECRDLLSFSVGQKQLRPLRLPMGLTTSPSIFQRIMRQIMSPFLNKFVHVYIDDCIIYSKSSEEHILHIRKVLEAFRKSGILLNASKCQFAVKSLKYLGFLISDQGWQILPNRKLEIKNFKKPRDQKELKRFIGVVGFLTHCSRNLQLLLDPLHKISGPKSKFTWTETQQKSFEKIKELIENSVLMSYPKEDPSFLMYLSTDSSDTGWGSVLSQIDEKGIERPLGFCSGAWKGSSLRWDIRNKEFHALVNALEYFYEFLFARHFIWRCDNQALAFLKNSLSGQSLKKNQRILRALDFVNNFNFTFELKKGNEPEMALPDYLSRRVEKDSKITRIAQINQIDLENFWSKSECNLAEFLSLQEADPDLKNAKSFKKSNRWKVLKSRGLVFKKCPETGLAKGIYRGCEKILVPKNYEEIMITFFHLPIHRSPKEIMRKFEDYLFPNMWEKCVSHVKKCQICVSLKPDKSFKPSMTKTSTGKHPWSDLMVDLLGPYSQTETGSKYIFVIACQLTGFSLLKPMPDKSAESVTKCFSEIFNTYGLPLSVSSDNGREFKNDRISVFFEKLKITQNFSSPYRPRTQGLVERKNQEILKYQKILKSSEADWDKDLPLIQFCINNSFNRNMKMSSFNAFHGWVPIVPQMATFPVNKDYTDLRQIDFDLATRVMKQRIVINDIFSQRETIKLLGEKSEEKPLSEGQKVLMNVPRPVGATKLFNPWKGLFVVIKRLDNDSYLVSPTDDPRRRYICYRARLRAVGEPDVKMSEKFVKFDKNGDITVEKTESKSENLPGYNLRPRSIDFRPYF